MFLIVVLYNLIMATITTPTLSEFKTWASQNRSLALAVCAARASAEVERKRVDAYIGPIFHSYGFTVDRHAQTPGELIDKPSNIYLSTDEVRVTAYFAECDAAHRAHGFTGKEGYCPALIAEAVVIDAENALLQAGCTLLGLKEIPWSMEHRREMLQLLLGACLKDEESA